jgi:hypothetical protein
MFRHFAIRRWAIIQKYNAKNISNPIALVQAWIDNSKEGKSGREFGERLCFLQQRLLQNNHSVEIAEDVMMLCLAAGDEQHLEAVKALVEMGISGSAITKDLGTKAVEKRTVSGPNSGTTDFKALKRVLEGCDTPNEKVALVEAHIAKPGDLSILIVEVDGCHDSKAKQVWVKFFTDNRVNCIRFCELAGKNSSANTIPVSLINLCDFNLQYIDPIEFLANDSKIPKEKIEERLTKVYCEHPNTFRGVKDIMARCNGYLWSSMAEPDDREKEMTRWEQSALDAGAFFRQPFEALFDESISKSQKLRE